jgi:hypothetical protein
LATAAPRGFTCLLNSGQQKRDKNRDDGDHNQKLDQREANARPIAKRRASCLTHAHCRISFLEDTEGAFFLIALHGLP